MLNANVNNNSNNLNTNLNNNTVNTNNSSASPEKSNNSKKEYNYTHNNLSKFINNPNPSSSINSSISLNNNINKMQNANQGFMPALDDMTLGDNDYQQNEKSVKNENALSIGKSIEKSYEPTSSASQTQKFPSDMSSYTNKFLTISKNLSK